MATTSSTKKTILSCISKSMPLYAYPRLSAAYLSTAYERAEGSNAVAEASSSDNGTVYEAKQQDLATTNDAAEDSPIKAVEESDTVRDTAKDSMDGAWKVAQDSLHKPKIGDGENDHSAGN